MIGSLRQLCSGTGKVTRDWDIMCLLYLFFFSAHFKFTLSSAHVQGAKNSIADAISCTQIMLKLSPLIHQKPVDIPTPFRELVLEKRSDWKFQYWRDSFSAILKRGIHLQEPHSLTLSIKGVKKI